MTTIRLYSPKPVLIAFQYALPPLESEVAKYKLTQTLDPETTIGTSISVVLPKAPTAVTDCHVFHASVLQTYTGNIATFVRQKNLT